MSPAFTFIHTSDWHLGLSLYGRDCRMRQEAMLARLAEVVADRRPDAVIVSGDIYDSAQPPVWATRLLVEGLAAVRRAGPEGMRIIVIAGNHDSAARHEAMSPLWAFAGIDMIGRIDRPEGEAPPADAFAEANARLVIHIPGKAYVVAVPYAHDRNIPDGFYPAMLAVARRNAREDLPVVMAAHCAVASDPGGEAVGGIDVRPLEAMGSGYDYLALGHIHRPASFALPGSPAIARYCGSPLAVSFDERFRHTFSLVSLSGHGPDARVDVEKITVNDPCPLVNIPAEGFAPWDDCLAELNAFPASRPCLLRINVLVDDFLHPEARDEAAAALEGKAAALCVINSRRADPAEGAASVADSMTVAEFRDTPPFDLAARYAADTAADFSPELMELFREIESSIE
jgi:exonuclease SbcD